MGYLIPKLEPNESQSMKIRVNPITQLATSTSLTNAFQQMQHDSLNNNTTTIEQSQNRTQQQNLTNSPLNASQQNYLINNSMGPPTSSSSILKSDNNSSATQQPQQQQQQTTRQPVRRRVRRKANSSPDDQAEQLTEMSVRGLNLFRYASISEGVYQCTECAKDNVQKTFKNKYSFQRHAFLYHEGTQRKVFPCPVCGKEFSRPDKMKNHMKTTHECYMPKDCVYPLNFLVGAGGDMPQIQVPPTTNAVTTGPVKIDTTTTQ